MPKINYDCNKIDLTHEAFIRLRDNGDVTLGIDDSLSQKIVTISGFGPTKSTANLAFYFWITVSILGSAYTVYLSFVSDWWWFIVGVVGSGIIIQANRKGHSENYLDAAVIDKEFYDRVRKINGWVYQMETDVAEKYLKRESLENYEKIVNEFGSFIENYDCATCITDISALPHPKIAIQKSIFASYLVSDNDTRELLKGGLLLLCRFQDGIGEVPLRGYPNPLDIDLTQDDDTVLNDYMNKREGTDEKKFLLMNEMAINEYTRMLESLKNLVENTEK